MDGNSSYEGPLKISFLMLDGNNSSEASGMVPWSPCAHPMAESSSCILWSDDPYQYPTLQMGPKGSGNILLHTRTSAPGDTWLVINWHNALCLGVRELPVEIEPTADTVR
jgi:hypothetical protein